MIRSATEAWVELLHRTLDVGVLVSPRDMLTRELLQQTICVDMRRSVVMVEERKLNYRFMAAEAYWILTGDDTVENIAPYNRNIAKFSDNGRTFFGAYGPKLHDQVDYVVGKLLEDPMSRQAGLTFWRENPPATKDVPCTVGMFFNTRGNQLNCHVFMRSSDQWLGVPYDIFNFSCIAYLICCRLNTQSRRYMETDLRPGALYLTAVSSHLYEVNWSQAADIVRVPTYGRQLMVPHRWYTDEGALYDELVRLREPGSPVSSLRWWKDA